MVGELRAIVDELGGEAVLGRRLNRNIDLQAAIREGFPQRVIEELMQAAGLSITELVEATADVPDDVSRVNVSPGSLSATWRQTPAPVELAAIGDRFARRRRDAILVVPSALTLEESNWLLNPDRPDFTRIRIRPPEPCAYDSRFFA